VKDVSREVFAQLLEFIYTGNMTYLPALVVDVWMLADKLQLERCAMLCSCQIQRYMKEEDVLSILYNANRVGLKTVKYLCFAFIKDHYKQVAMMPEVNELPNELLIELLRLPAGGMQEKQQKPFSLPASTLQSDLRKLVGAKQWSDVVFSIQGEIIYAHHCILSARNSVFATMFESGMRESSSGVVEVADVSPKIFLYMLYYLYSGVLIEQPTFEEYLLLMQVSDRYLLDVLKECCAREIAYCADVGNCLSVLEAADACQLSDLKHLALEIASDNFARIALAPDLRALPQHLLVDIIQTHGLRTSHLLPHHLNQLHSHHHHYLQLHNQSHQYNSSTHGDSSSSGSSSSSGGGGGGGGSGDGFVARTQTHESWGIHL